MRTFVCLLALSACAAHRSDAAPPQSPTAGSLLGPGDVVSLHTLDDPELSGDATLGADGAIDVPYCGHVALGGSDAEGARAKIAECLVSSGAYTRAPLVAVSVTSGQTVRLFVGPDRTRRDVRYELGLTVVGVLAEALALRRTPSRVSLRRSGVTYEIDVDAIARGDRANEPLEPGDEVDVAENIPIRPPPPRPRGSPLGVRPAASNETCGELVLRNAELAAEGKGERHHDVVATRDAIVHRCGDGAGASLVEACRVARLRKLDLSSDHGPNHPAVRALDAAIRVCPADSAAPEPPPTATECAALRERRAALTSAGKGANHPEVVAADVRLGECARAR